MQADGIIFDLDGTLWDSCRAVSESWQQTVRRLGDTGRVITEDEIRSIMGMTAEEIAGKLFRDYGGAAMEICRACLRDECVYLSRHGGTVYPGVGDVLKRLSASASLFIVSNCQDGYIECFLDCSGFGPYFRGFLHPGATGLDKAGNIRLTIDRYGLTSPVYVGDTEMDAAAARKARCPFIHAAYGFGSVAGGVPAIRSPLELERTINMM